MNLQKITHEFESLARFLDMAYMPRAASAVRSLQDEDLITNDAWHERVFAIYRDEVITSLNFIGEPDPKHRQTLLVGMDTLTRRAMTHPEALRAFLLNAHAITEAIGESHGNTRELYKSFIIPTSSNKHVFLNLCLMYLILCEGVFTNQARVLLGCDVLSRGERHNIFELTTSVLVQKLLGRGMGAFTAGYDRHIRNSIAHGHFQYNPNLEVMRFRDFKYQQGKLILTYDESWPLQKFAWMFAKMDDVYLVVSSYLQIAFLPLVKGLL